MTITYPYISDFLNLLSSFPLSTHHHISHSEPKIFIVCLTEQDGIFRVESCADKLVLCKTQPWFVAFANFCSVNIPTMSSFHLPMVLTVGLQNSWELNWLWGAGSDIAIKWSWSLLVCCEMKLFNRPVTHQITELIPLSELLLLSPVD